jgi:hypothetical protein
MNAIEKIQILKEKINNEERASKPIKFIGQAWGGANCMVISNDRETQQYFEHFKGEILSTVYAKEIGNLYNSIKDLLDESSGYNHLTKLELWGELTIAGKDFINSTPNYDLRSLELKIINEAIEIIKKWQ